MTFQDASHETYDELWVCGSSVVRGKEGDRPKVIPPTDQVVVKLDTSGKVLLRVSLPKTADPPGKLGEVNWVHGIAVDSQGNLYLGDIQGRRAQKFSPQTR